MLNWIVAGFVLVFIINWVMLHFYRIKTYIVESDKIIEPYKILLISDLHMAEYGKCNSRLIDDVKEIMPDIILVAGDIIVTYPVAYDGVRNNYKWADKIADFFGTLGTMAPVYMVDGNHEIVLKSAYEGAYLPVCETYETKLKKNNVNLLDNESVFCGNNTYLYGLNLSVEYYAKRASIQLPDNELEAALGKTQEHEFCILLTHNPTYFEKYVEWGADLVLCGHMHGGLLRLGQKGLLGPERRFFPKYCYGRYKNKDSTMIISAGLGHSHRIPIRITNPMEIVLVKLYPQKEK